jgi:hypothetical protein
MKKYLKHNLTREEDNVLGAFGHDLDSEGLPHDRVRLSQFDIPEHKINDVYAAARSLRAKGLLYIDNDTLGQEVYHLTVKGKQLWKIRAKEEEEPRQ